jgi:hypothetical protein
MTTLPFASTDHCRRCGASVDPDRFRYSLVTSAAHDEVHTGNLCADCFAAVVAFLEGES